MIQLASTENTDYRDTCSLKILSWKVQNFKLESFAALGKFLIKLES